MATLREQMQRDLQLRGLSPKTQRAYLDKARDFARYFSTSHRQASSRSIGRREYQGIPSLSACRKEGLGFNLQASIRLAEVPLSDYNEAERGL